MSGELSVAAISQLSLWLSENPGVDSEENIIPDRPLRNWPSANNNLLPVTVLMMGSVNGSSSVLLVNFRITEELIEE